MPMALRKQKHAHAKTTLPPPWAAAHLHAAGIDVGAEAQDVAVPPRDDPQPVRGFAADTAALDALAAWVVAWALTTVAMASPGVSWLPLFARCEARGFAGLVVDPQHGQHIKGRPTSDVQDCQGSQRRHPWGLLASAFRPTDQLCGLRRSLRQRARLLTSAGQPIQPRHKARTPMHHKVSPVVSDRTGVTGLAMLRARLAGARDPVQLAPRRADRCQHDEATIARALEGHGREAPLGSLAPAVALSDGYHQQSMACDRQSEASLQTCADRPPGQALPPAPRPRQRGRHQPAFPVRAPLPRIPGVALSQIEGLDETTSLGILSESGLDRRRWPTVQHCTAWWGLCPHQRVSGGQGLSRRTTSCANRAATARRWAAAALPHRQSA